VRVDSETNITSYNDVEVRLIVNQFSVSKEGKHAFGYQSNLFRDDEVKTFILKYRHSVFQTNAKDLKADEFPDLSKAGKKGVDAGAILSLQGAKRTDFAQASATKTVDLKDIFIQEKGQAAYNVWQKREERGSNKAAGKKATPKRSVGKRSGKTLSVAGKRSAKAESKDVASPDEEEPSPEVIKRAISKILQRKKTTALTGKRSAQKKTPASRAKMTLSDYKKYLEWYVSQNPEGKKSKGPSGKGSRAGKASAGKKSAGKASTRSKK
jgi:hypothetical protein